jgi:hypothetical protein
MFEKQFAPESVGIKAIEEATAQVAGYKPENPRRCIPYVVAILKGM